MTWSIPERQGNDQLRVQFRGGHQSEAQPPMLTIRPISRTKTTLTPVSSSSGAESDAKVQSMPTPTTASHSASSRETVLMAKMPRPPNKTIPRVI